MFSKLSAKRNSKWEVKDESVIEMAELRKKVVGNSEVHCVSAPP